ncbi:MAG: ABC transporter ATP-binding protein [Promethearchaeota archaeon]
MTDLLKMIIINIILYVVGFFRAKRLINFEKWNKSPVVIAFTLNTIWLIFDFTLNLLVLNSLGYSILFNIILHIASILIGIIVLWGFFNRSIRESLIIICLIQIVLIIISLSLESAQLIYEILIIGGETLEAPIIGFFISFLFLLGFSSLYVKWGTKIQLVKYRRTVTYLGITPGTFYLIFTFIVQPEGFYNDIIIIILTSFIIAFISSFLVKKVGYTTIQYQEIRGLHVLEKDKSLLRVENLKVYFPLLMGILKRQVGAVKAVNGVSFEVKTGETLGLVGESGCGKTTIANAILNLVDKTGGEMYFHDEPLPAKYSSDIRQKIQIVFQDPDASLNPHMKVFDVIAEPLKNLLGLTDKTELRKHVLRLLEQVSLKREHMDRYPHEFSGGQKQRIIIARALACNPELIILDEPTSALDVSVQAQILNLLKNLQRKYGYGFLFITHNLAVVHHIADKIAVMYLGNIVEVGSREKIFSNPTHPYTKALLASRPEIDPENQEISFVIEGEVPSPIAPPPGCTFNPRCVSDARTKECEFELPHKIEIEEDHYIWCVNPPTAKGEKIEGFF